MKLAIASDHAGYRYKTILIQFLSEQDHEIVDFGTHSEESTDYPDYVRPATESVARGDCERGIVLGGSGNGEAMVANRIAGIRCALCWDVESARLSRSHNDSNMLSLGQRMLSEEKALAIVSIWLDTPFEGGRHVRRIEKMDM